MRKHVNIPIFIPHLGCPNQCTFCNQRSISGVHEFDENSVVRTIEDSLATISADCEVEIAFFGGSFTGIDRDLMLRLLKIAKGYIDKSLVSSVRCSTRPDYINEETLDILRQNGVKTIELGLQSISDDVLLACRRGHTAADAERACKMIIEYGFNLVGQMMIGLPSANLESEIETARFICRMSAVGARIYPTIVFRDTELAESFSQGVYSPLALQEAVERTAAVFDIFIKNGVNVIRIGLCDSENLHSDATYLCGPNHPAIGELVESAVFYRRIIQELIDAGFEKENKYVILVARGALSKAIGHKKINYERLISELGLANVRFCEDNSLSGYELLIKQERN